MYRHTIFISIAGMILIQTQSNDNNTDYNKNVLYMNIDQTLPNKLHGPTHCKIVDTCVYNGHVFYTLL